MFYVNIYLFFCFLAFGNDLKRNINSQSAWEQSQPSNMAMIKDLQVQCEKDMMRVRILFDRPFYGMVFSKGHYSNVNCVHVPSGLGQTSVSTILDATGPCSVVVTLSLHKPAVKSSTHRALLITLCSRNAYIVSLCCISRNVCTVSCNDSMEYWKITY